MSILSRWMAKDRANRAFVMSLGVLTAVNVAAVATKVHLDKKEHPVELAKIAASMDKSSSLAQDQIRMLPSYYSRLTSLVRQGHLEEARKYSEDLATHLKSVREMLPVSLEHGISMISNIDGVTINMSEALKSLEPALKTRDQGALERAAMKLFVAIDGKADIDLTDNIKPLPMIGG